MQSYYDDATTLYENFQRGKRVSGAVMILLSFMHIHNPPLFRGWSMPWKAFKSHWTLRVGSLW